MDCNRNPNQDYVEVTPQVPYARYFLFKFNDLNVFHFFIYNFIYIKYFPIVRFISHQFIDMVVSNYLYDYKPKRGDGTN